MPAILLCLLAGAAVGQEMIVKIRVSGSMAEIDGKFATPRKNLSLLDNYAGAVGLAKRISEVKLTDSNGQSVGAKRFNDGEYISVQPITGWKYTVDLRPPSNRPTAAHTSWVGSDVGLLMLDDLLPQIGEASSANVQFELPDGWKIYGATRELNVPDVAKAVFTIGRNLRERTIAAAGTQIRLVTAGEWQFTDQDTSDVAKEIFEYYVKVFGSSPRKEIQVVVLRFPGDAPVGNWEADTRGSTVTILSSDMAFRTQGVQRLHEQLRHELFHIWMPNGVNLSGNYDWFYEGFALYQSLKLGVAVNRLRFDDYLDSMSRAFLMDGFEQPKTGLIELSKNRFDGSGTQVYARGMIAAFLCDLALLDRSKGKFSTDTLVREIYQKHSLSTTSTNANDAILTVMRLHAELSPIVDNYITGAGKVDLASMLAVAGLEMNGKALRVIAKPSGRQKDLLNKLGYNNWRKLGTR